MAKPAGLGRDSLGWRSAHVARCTLAPLTCLPANHFARPIWLSGNWTQAFRSTGTPGRTAQRERAASDAPRHATQRIVRKRAVDRVTAGLPGCPSRPRSAEWRPSERFQADPFVCLEGHPAGVPLGSLASGSRSSPGLPEVPGGKPKMGKDLPSRNREGRSSRVRNQANSIPGSWSPQN